MPSRDFTREDLFSSRMMSMQSSTHSSQMNTVGPAISLRTSCWLLPQNEQYSVFLESPPLLLTLLMSQVLFSAAWPMVRFDGLNSNLWPECAAAKAVTRHSAAPYPEQIRRTRR